MPGSDVRQRLDPETLARPAWHRLLPVAAAFAVSPSALLWRMVNLNLTSRVIAEELDALRRDRQGGGESIQEGPLPLRFVLLAFRAWCDGKISLGKLAELMETTVGLVEPTLAEYGVDMENDAEEAADLSA
jgi:predicted HTH domain antitoxin